MAKTAKVKSEVTSQTYATLRVMLELAVPMKDLTLESALETARAMIVSDVVSWEGDYNDGTVEVTGVYQ